MQYFVQAFPGLIRPRFERSQISCAQPVTRYSLLNKRWQFACFLFSVGPLSSLEKALYSNILKTHQGV